MTQRTRWSCLVTDVRTSTVVARDVPMTSMTFTDSLTDGGTFTGSYPAEFPAFSKTLMIGNDLLRRVFWPMRDGQPMGAYIFTGIPPTDIDAVEQQVHGSRIDSVLGKRLIRQTLNFTNVDQCDIYRDLVRYGLGRTTEHSTPSVSSDSDAMTVPWIRLDSTMSGVLRTRQETTGNTDDGYPADARKIVGTCLKQLTELSDQAAGTTGPEARLNYAMDPVTELPYVTVTLGYPQVGHPAGDPAKPVFEFPGGNILSVKNGADGTAIVTRADVTGQEKEGSKPIGTATYQELHDQGFPLWEGTWSESSVQDVTLLGQKAQGRLHGAQGAWSITLDGNRRPLLGSYDLGDYAWLRLKRGGRRLADTLVRITGWSVAVDDSGVSEIVTPTVEEVPWWLAPDGG